MTTGETSFPRLSARTQRFTLGAPRDLAVSADGARVIFLRSGGPEDPVNALWCLDVATGEERLAADPGRLLADDTDEGADLPPEERARRERARESAGGIVSYALDRAARRAVAPLGGRLVVADLVESEAQLVEVPGPVFDPRPSPDGRWVAWCRDRSLWVAPVDDPAAARELAGPGDDDGPDVRWGQAEFIAAEEMGRWRGHWWAADGGAVLVARVDEAAVQRWWIADPANPGRPPAEIAYPAAGTANADVSLWICPLTGPRREVAWDRAALPYLADARWDAHGILLTLQSRDQRRVEVRAVDPDTGESALLSVDEDEAWVELVPGVPARLEDGQLVTCADRDGVRRLLVAGEPVTPPSLTVRAVAHVGRASVVCTASDPDDGTSVHVWRWSAGGLQQVTGGDGVHTAAAGGGVVALRSATLDAATPSFELATSDEEDPHQMSQVRRVRSFAVAPPVDLHVRIEHLTGRRLATALVLPSGPPDGEKLPVLLDPYGGPHAQRVLRSGAAFAASQWFADQGFAVVVVDGRGTPGRGSAFERAVHRDLAGPVLDDQVDALLALAELEPRLDLDRVAIRGWSFGGYLAALAVLRRPDVFHAAVAGAPVTEWRLYDTHYTERYLGDPTIDPGPYDATSLLTDAHRLERPLLLVHGLADDNVVAAHTLQLSAALLAAGRPHEVLPLTGVTHLASQEEVAENLLLLQLDFLRRSLATGS